MVNNHINSGITQKVSYFASPHRSSLEELYKDIDEISISSLISEILNMVPNFLAVLNSNRQIITINYSFLGFLGIDNTSDLLGLRLGEALHCIYSDDMPAGCGTSKYCSTCGAAISIVSALEDNQNHEAYCAISALKNGQQVEYFFAIRSSRIVLDKKKYILVFLNDITEQQKRTYLENTFFGDIANLINTLNKNINYISENPSELEAQCFNVKKIAKLINNEVEYQKALFNPVDSEFIAESEHVSVNQLFDSLKKIFETHPVADDINFSIIEPNEDIIFTSDGILITRILMHMLLNAFEHSKLQSVVRLWTNTEDNHITFKVWNDDYIPEEVAIRIFRKYFTTYNSIGKGLGTYFIKYFGEKVLGGKVDFTTSKLNGTTFSLSLPNTSNKP